MNHINLNTVVLSETNFEVTVKALLHGYKKHTDATTHNLVNVVVLNTTADRARCYVENTLRSNVPDNLMCLGLDNAKWGNTRKT